jgi:hypothetical protein
MRIEILDEGFICRLSANERSERLAVGSRVVSLNNNSLDNGLVDNGELVCSFMMSRGLAVNDFVPVLSRSGDLGKTWSEPKPIWPSLKDSWALFVSISRDQANQLYLYGTRCAIDQPGESNWSDATQGLKQNELIWASSGDLGHGWTGPTPVPKPTPGSAEAPGPLCVTSSGRWIACYAPCNSFDPHARVERNQVVVVYSDDQGVSWQSTAMLRFADGHSSAAEAWVVELSDGRLLGTSWHVPPHGDDLPNAFAVSHDGGTCWHPTRSTGIMGQTTAMAPWTDRRALFLYNQRKHGEPGVWLAVVRPTAANFGIEHNQIVWKAPTATRSKSSGDLREWSDFSFGEPSITPLSDDTWLVALWCVQPTGTGIRYVKLKLHA